MFNPCATDQNRDATVGASGVREPGLTVEGNTDLGFLQSVSMLEIVSALHSGAGVGSTFEQESVWENSYHG